MNTGGNPLPQLGLVCITASDAVRYRAMTRKRLLQLDAAEQKSALRLLYADNLARVDAAIDYCLAHNIRLYRLASSLFPFADDPVGEDVLEEFSEVVAAKGQRALDSGIRLVLHPDQFVVLNSESPQVVENSIKILQTHARVMDMLAQPRSSWAVIEIHGGKGGRAKQLVRAIRKLPKDGRESFNDRQHSDLITLMPSAYRDAPWIEVEAKHKELAIEKLRNESFDS
jgi:UV DNA damage endonuclease